jgi:hypothetical protein
MYTWAGFMNKLSSSKRTQWVAGLLLDNQKAFVSTTVETTIQTMWLYQSKCQL